MEYTKGEWEANKSPMGDWVISTEDTLICRGARHFNANLIAAAPDLYEVGCEALNCINGIIPADLMSKSAKETAQKLLRKALTKAEGK